MTSASMGGASYHPARIDAVDQAQIAKALADPKVKETLLGLGLRPDGELPEQFEKIYTSSRETAARLIKAAGVKMQWRRARLWNPFLPGGYG